MTFPERFSELPPYAFPRLRTLLDGINPGKEPIDMTIGNPMHQFPQWISNILNEHISEFRGYPPNDGTNEIRVAISKWLKFRYGVDYDFENQIFPLNGRNAGSVIGLRMKQGKFERNSTYRLLRNGEVVAENLKVRSLRILKQDVQEVPAGSDCGLLLEDSEGNGILGEIGDEVECYSQVEVGTNGGAGDSSNNK